MKMKKVQIGNDQEMAQSERNSHSINRGVGKSKMTLTYVYHEKCRKPSEQLFPNRRPLSYPNRTKNMKTYIRLKQYKNWTTKHNTIRTTTEVSLWNDQ